MLDLIGDTRDLVAYLIEAIVQPDDLWQQAQQCIGDGVMPGR
jgi:hypothetical protein